MTHYLLSRNATLCAQLSVLRDRLTSPGEPVSLRDQTATRAGAIFPPVALGFLVIGLPLIIAATTAATALFGTVQVAAWYVPEWLVRWLSGAYAVLVVAAVARPDSCRLHRVASAVGLMAFGFQGLGFIVAWVESFNDVGGRMDRFLTAMMLRIMAAAVVFSWHFIQGSRAELAQHAGSR